MLLLRLDRLLVLHRGELLLRLLQVLKLHHVVIRVVVVILRDCRGSVLLFDPRCASSPSSLSSRVAFSSLSCASPTAPPRKTFCCCSPAISPLSLRMTSKFRCCASPVVGWCSNSTTPRHDFTSVCRWRCGGCLDQPASRRALDEGCRANPLSSELSVGCLWFFPAIHYLEYITVV